MRARLLEVAGDVHSLLSGGPCCNGEVAGDSWQRLAVLDGVVTDTAVSDTNPQQYTREESLLVLKQSTILAQGDTPSMFDVSTSCSSIPKKYAS